MIETRFSCRHIFDHILGSPMADLNNMLHISIRHFKNYTFDPRHEICNNVVCATSKASDQPAHMRSLNRDFASGLNILCV